MAGGARIVRRGYLNEAKLLDCRLNCTRGFATLHRRNPSHIGRRLLCWRNAMTTAPSVGSIMSRSLVTVSIDDTLEHIAFVLERNRIHHVVVTDEAT